jgi:peroxiredoxin
MAVKAGNNNAPKRLPSFVWVVLVALVMFAAYQVYNRMTTKQAPPGGLAVRDAGDAGTSGLTGRAAPAFTLRDLDGRVKSLDDYRDRVVVLNFWTTWCRPCNMEIPDFITLQNTYRGKGVRFVGISLDEPGQEAMLRGFVRSKGINYDILLGDQNISALYGGVQSIPTTFLIGPDGTIRSMFAGLQPKYVWTREIEAALAAAK